MLPTFYTAQEGLHDKEGSGSNDSNPEAENGRSRHAWGPRLPASVLQGLPCARHAVSPQHMLAEGVSLHRAPA